MTLKLSINNRFHKLLGSGVSNVTKHCCTIALVAIALRPVPPGQAWARPGAPKVASISSPRILTSPPSVEGTPEVKGSQWFPLVFVF